MHVYIHTTALNVRILETVQKVHCTYIVCTHIRQNGSAVYVGMLVVVF